MQSLYDLFVAAKLTVRYREGILPLEQMAHLQQWLAASDRHKAWFDASLDKEGQFPIKLGTFIQGTLDSPAVFTEICARVGLDPGREGRPHHRGRSIGRRR